MPGDRDGYQFAVDRDLLIALGRLAYSASYVESVVSTMFRRLLDSDPELGDRVVADASMQWLLDHVGVLMDYRFEDDETTLLELRAWLRRVDGARRDRNRVLHSIWYFDATDPTQFRHGLMKVSARGRKFKSNAELVTPDQLHAIARELEAAGLEGVHLMRPVIERLGPFVDKPPRGE